MLRLPIALIAVLLVCLAEPALAQKKIALVVGIDTYDNLRGDKQLQRAVNDARAVGKAFGALGFQVMQTENATRVAFNAQWQSFLEKVGPGDTAAVYFSGHGIEIEGLNYLFPRDVPFVRYGRLEQLKRESLSVAEFLLDLRKRRPKVTLLILDACRDHPLIPAEYRSAGAPAGGLARMDAPEGTFIMYAAGAGETALDRLPKDDPDKLNSVYTRTLLPLLTKPGLALPELAREVRSEVSAIVATVPHVQRPAYYDGLIGKFCLAGCKTNVNETAWAVPPAPPRPTQSLPVPKASSPASAKTAGSPDSKQLELWRNALQPATFKMQAAAALGCCWSDTFAKRLASLSGNKLKVEALAPGAIVPVGDQIDAVSAGKVIMGWSGPGFWTTKSVALHIHAGQIAFGHDQARFIRWMRDRGEAELNQLYQGRLKLKIRALACGTEGPEGIWFKKPLNTRSDLKELRIRTVGLPLLVMQKLGARAQYMPPGELMSALERGTIDGAEFGQPWNDEELGLPRVASNYYYPSWHAPTALWQLDVNLDTWNGLSEAQRGLISEACRQNIYQAAAAYQTSAKNALSRIKGKGVQVRPVPKDILDAVRSAQDEIVRDFSTINPDFKRAWESYSTFR